MMLPLFDATKENYTFDGWYLDSQFNQRIYVIDTNSNQHLTFYAKWNVEGSLGVNFTDNRFDENGFIKVANSAQTFNFNNNYFEVSSGATWTISSDISGNNVINSKVSTIVVGNNTFYLNVYLGNQVQQIELTVRRREIYTVTFNSNGGSTIDAQDVEEDQLAEKPSNPTKSGWTFGSWNHIFTTPITGNKTFTATWEVIEYNITYNLVGGTNHVSNPTQVYSRVEYYSSRSN